jgi:hypothetical protein
VIDDVLRTYIDIHFEQITNDYSTGTKNNPKTERFEARACEQRDFGNTPPDIANYKKWDGFSIICPVFKEN